MIIFNRAKSTEMVFKQVARVRPQKLFVIADGPRPGHPEDEGNCAAARAVIERVDWECQVIKNYSDVNLGVGVRPASGLSWLFEQVDRAIIFEDDCVPHLSFFPFCEELLERYRDDPRVMHISGWCPFEAYFGTKMPYSYYFSRALSGHGWATWARAWRHFDFDIKTWPALKNTGWLREVIGYPKMVNFMSRLFEHHFLDTGNQIGWDHQWSFSVWAQNGLGIRPGVNLIHYHGFDEDATHRFWCKKQEYFDQPASAMAFPLSHPRQVVREQNMDYFLYKTFFSARPRDKRFKRLYGRTRARISAVLPEPAKDLIRKWR